MSLPEQALPLDNEEAETLLSVAMASTERSAFRLWCRLVDMSSLESGALGDRGTAEALVDLSDEVELAMQILDRTYRRLSVAYFEAVGPDEPWREGDVKTRGRP